MKNQKCPACGAALAEDVVSVCGVEVSLQAEEIDLAGVKKVKLSQFMQELDQLENLKRVDMWDANLSKDDIDKAVAEAARRTGVARI